MDEFLDFSSIDQELLTNYFQELKNKINLTKKENELLINDFKRAILYLNKEKSLKEILKLLNLDNLGDIYKEPITYWFPLDNSAKIYPTSMKENWMSVYRLSYYLDDLIVPELMQIALLFTMKRFPTFATSIRKGFFWHYIDGIQKRFQVEEENRIPTSPINVSRIGKQSFKVFYYQNRISVEIFHILADAYGGITFLSSLVSEYLKLKGEKIKYNDLVLDINESVKLEELKDEFIDKSIISKKGNLLEKKAIPLDGKLSNVRPCKIIHFDLDLKKLKGISKKYNATINELVLTYLFLVMSYSTSKEGFLKIQVPVNMRKYYKSKTLRNFSLYNYISIKKSDINDFESLIKMIKNQSQEKLSKNKLNEVMLSSNRLVKSIKWIPLFIKKPIAKFIFGFIGDKAQTTVLSNLGNIKLPESILKHIKSADFVLGTSISNKALFTLITVNNITTLSMSKFTTNTALENNLYNILKENDLVLRVHGSENYEN